MEGGMKMAKTTDMFLRELSEITGHDWQQQLQEMYAQGCWTNGASLEQLMELGPDRLHGPVEIIDDATLPKTAKSIHVRARTMARIHKQTGRSYDEIKTSMKFALRKAKGKGLSPDQALNEYWNQKDIK